MRQKVMREIKTALPDSSDDWLGLSDQPLQGLLPALLLQLCPDHLAARPVVVVHPVSLQERGEVAPLEL